MRILWLTNHVMPDLARTLNEVPSPRGGWMPALAEAIVEQGGVDLAVATLVKGQDFFRIDAGDICYYALPMPAANLNRGHLPESMISEYQRVVDEFRPDVIHIHGTEYFQGLLTGRGHLNCATVISIQGIIDACRKYYWGGIPFKTLLATRTLRDWIRLDGLIEQKKKWSDRAKWEREVFRSNAAFTGRTLWDRAQTRKLNPGARYYHCDELLRQPFHEAQWDIKNVNRHSIFVSGANYPLKGFHILVKAVALLVDEFPDVRIRTPLAQFYPKLSRTGRIFKNMRATGYARYLTGLIRAEGLEDRVVSFPSLNADGMVKELLTAHVFALPSTIENSPNSLCEAMLVGTPSVASFVGGVPSLAEDGISTLFFPRGDEVLLAEQIRRIFRDDDLACNLSVQARKVASARHSRERVARDMLEIYRSESASGGQVEISDS